MRAVLLASATATTSGGRRRRNPITHGSALVAFDRSKLALAPLIRSRRKYWLPRLDIPPRRCLPPVEFCRGTRPSQAANSRPLRKPLVALIADNGDQLADVAQALRRDHAELGQMPAQSVHQTRTLAHQPLSATVQQHGSLLVSRLDRHKAHRRAPNRLADRFGIGGIVLVALGRHQS